MRKNENNKKNYLEQLSRREFLKLTGALAATGLGEKVFGAYASALQPASGVQFSPDDIWLYSYCKMCIIPHCGIRVLRKDGVIVNIKGDPEHPFNKGTLCPRGFANITNLYNPYRVKAPMKRTNPEKGLDIDPGWVEISWEEAMSTIAEKLRKIHSTDPRGLIVESGFGSMRDDFPMSRVVFPLAFGTPNTTESNGPLCPVHYAPLSVHGTFCDRYDIGRCTYLICVGGSVGGDFAIGGGDTRNLVNAIQRGMKLVIVNPRSSPEAAMGEWVPIRPGTDLAMMLGMAYVMIHEIGKLDEWFLKVRSNAPYLIKEDGYYAREPETGKPLLWDENRGQAVPFDSPDLTDAALKGEYIMEGEKVSPAFYLLSHHLKQYTPEWAEGITSIPAKTIRRIAQEFVDAAKIGSTIELDGFIFPHRPVALFGGRSAGAHRGGNYVMLMAKIINLLVGASDVPGSVIAESVGPWLTPGPDGIVQPDPRKDPKAREWYINEFTFPPNHLDLVEFFPNRHCTPFVAWRAILDPEKYYINYEPKALMVHGGNPFQNNTNSEEVERAWRKIPFIFSIAYHFDEPTQFTDILLPEASNLERLNIYEAHLTHKGVDDETRGLSTLQFKHPVVAPVYNARDANDILMDLAARIGIHPTVNGILNGFLMLPERYQLAPPKVYRWDEVFDRALRGRFGDDKGIQYFIKHGSTWTARRVPLRETYNYFYFPEGKTRIPIYFEHLKKAGDSVVKNCAERGIRIPGWKTEAYLAYFQPLPVWIPHPEHQALDGFDLYAINWKIATRAFGMGGFAEDPVIREMQALYEPEVDVILLNAATARARGLKEGDHVVVESQFGGKVQGIIRTTQLVHPEVVGFAGNFGHRAPLMGQAARKGLNYNQLLTAADGMFDPVVGAIDVSAAVKLSKV